MLVDTASQNQEQMDAFYGTFLISLISREDIFILEITSQNDYWSASWQPVGKDLSVYKSECHHGTAYTKMIADYSDIHIGGAVLCTT